MKRIFVFSNYLPYASVAYVLKAIKRIGIDVTLVGPESGYEKHIYLAPDGDVLDIFRKYDQPDLALFVETSTGTKFFPENIQKIPGKTAFWAIDNHLNFRWHKEYAVLFDYVFFAQPAVIRWLRRFKIRAFPLLNACDPEIHKNYNFEKKYDVVFVGKLTKSRREFFHLLLKNCPDLNFGIFNNIYLDEMSKIYSLGRAGLNLPVRKDINMRTFEIPACGLLLFTPQIEGIDETLPPDACVYYNNPAELPRLLYHFMKLRPDEFEFRRKKGEEIVRVAHTYENRIKEMLKIIENNKPARSGRTEVHLSFLFAHRNARDNKRRLKYLIISLRKYPLFTLLYHVKYFIFYIIEAILKNIGRWPY
jgi:hypothetical protein